MYNSSVYAHLHIWPKVHEAVTLKFQSPWCTKKFRYFVKGTYCYVCVCLERDTSGDVLWTWSYPSVSQQQRDLLTRKSQLSGDAANVPPFVYGQWQRQWYYIRTTQVQDGEPLPKVCSTCIYFLNGCVSSHQVACYRRGLQCTLCRSLSQRLSSLKRETHLKHVKEPTTHLYKTRVSYYSHLDPNKRTGTIIKLGPNVHPVRSY